MISSQNIWGFYKLYDQLVQKTKLLVDFPWNNVSLYQPDNIMLLEYVQRFSLIGLNP